MNYNPTFPIVDTINMFSNICLRGKKIVSAEHEEITQYYVMEKLWKKHEKQASPDSRQLYSKNCEMLNVIQQNFFIGHWEFIFSSPCSSVHVQ
jgi:hypothetical protein